MSRWSIMKPRMQLVFAGLLILAVLCCSPIGFMLREGDRSPPFDISKSYWRENVSNSDFLDYKILLSPRRLCSSSVRYLFMVTSYAVNKELRETLRETWVKDILNDAFSQVIFVLGRPSSTDIQNEIVAESQRHGDILQYSFSDTYRNATIKSVLNLHYASKCSPQFLVKVDDDVYLNVYNLHRAVESINSMYKPPFIIGGLYPDGKPIQDADDSLNKKWHETYPDFVFGHLYVISGSALKDMYSMALRTRPIFLEDVFITGVLAAKLTIPRIGHPRIGLLSKPEVNFLFEDYITEYHVTSERIRELHKELQHTLIHCVTYFGLNACRKVFAVSSIVN